MYVYSYFFMMYLSRLYRVITQLYLLTGRSPLNLLAGRSPLNLLLGQLHLVMATVMMSFGEE